MERKGVSVASNMTLPPLPDFTCRLTAPLCRFNFLEQPRELFRAGVESAPFVGYRRLPRRAR